MLLITLDNTILYTALPTLTAELEAGASESLWVINAYPLVMCGLLLGAGTLGDRYGHRRLFLIGLVLFGAASLAAAFAPDVAVLIAARALLAVGAACMMPATLALIRIGFDDVRQRTSPSGCGGASPSWERLSARSSADCCLSTSGGVPSSSSTCPWSSPPWS